MTITVLQHVPFEGPASIAAWAQGRGHRVELVRLWAGDALPDPTTIDLLVIMGGPMSVWESDRFRWLIAEEHLVRAALAEGVPTLGVCLGAQMIARAMGAPVYPGAQREIGWFPVEVDGKALEKITNQRVPPLTRLTAFHWHGDTFDLPAGARPLASTPATPNQAFSKALAGGSLALALQFHLEANEESVRALVTACADEIGGGTYEMSRERSLVEALEGLRAHSGFCRALLDPILERLERAAIGRRRG
jgi:GMP synthase-like glutamine amidotransferase